MTIDLSSISVVVLKRAVEIKGSIESLTHELASILGGTAPASASKAPQKRKMSAASRAKIAAAAKARWAKIKGAKPAAKVPAQKQKRKMSAAAKAKLSAMAKARWAKVKATGKKSL
jgi:hypothetical protein